MKLYAISDLHVNRAPNWEALQALPAHPADWLIVAGDVSESEAQFAAAMALLSQRFARVLWTPGNHDLWAHPNSPAQARGIFKYNRLVSICRAYGVLTPEDPYPVWPGADGQAYVIAPIFTLYDYSFRPEDVSVEEAVAWAAETNIVSTDEYYLFPDPFASRQAWCAARCRYTEGRLQSLNGDQALVLAGHFPLRQDLVQLYRIPRFSIWCGTRLTEEWHRRFPVKAVVHGHLHIRARHERDGVTFHEVSLGYPHQWQAARGVAGYLRQVLPGEG